MTATSSNSNEADNEVECPTDILHIGSYHQYLKSYCKKYF